MWKIIKWVFGVLFVLFLIGLLMEKSNKNTKSTNSATNVGVEIKKPEKLVATPEPKLTSAELLTKAKKLIDENNSDAAIGNLQLIKLGSKEYSEAQKLFKQELLREAKKLLNEKPKYGPADNSETYLWQAASKLEFIKKGDKEYSEAQNLLQQVHARQQMLQPETIKPNATARKDYAKELEFIFLDKLRMDTTVTVSGKDNTIIKIKWILWTRVTVYEFFKDGKIMNTWRSMGFKKYILTDGYRWTWRQDL